MTEPLDISRNEDGEITQFLIIEGGEPTTKLATAENLLLYDPEDTLPFDGGMHSFLSGENALKLGDDIVVAQSNNDHSYILSIDGNVVETTPRLAEPFLGGVYEAIAEDDDENLRKLHDRILENQVRRELVNTLKKTFSESRRITITANGWLVDSFYLVDWNANMYAANDDPDKGDFVRDGSSTTRTDKSYEFVRISHDIGSFDSIEIRVGGDDYTLTEREMLFLAKVKWLLHRRHYHPDEPFWSYADRWAEIEEEEPNLDVFDI